MLVRDGNVKTRKPHKCHGCGQKIPAGSTMYKQTVVDDGIYSIYICTACTTFCESRHCEECLEQETAWEGYVRECKADGAGGVGAESRKRV